MTIPLLRSHSSRNHWQRVLCLLAIGISLGLRGFALQIVQNVDVPTKDPGFYLHHFEYDPPRGTQPRSVTVAGEFNNWSTTQFPMKLDGAGHYVADVKLSEGPHAYRFFVDGKWVNDSADHSEADLEEPNSFTGHNSAVFVGPEASSEPALQPGKIVVQDLHHVPTNMRYFDPISADETRVAIGARAGNLSSVTIYSRSGQTWRRDDLYRVQSRSGIDFFGGVVVSSTPNLQYFFELRDGSTVGYYSGGKYFTRLAEGRRSAWHGVMLPAFETPEWAQHAIWYQIFPERFRNGSKANDPANTASWTRRWNSASTTGDTPRSFKDSPGRRFYGGDIEGIREELPYLRSLGVTCIYLNPIFKSPSVHKYDTTDYRHVDDNFGYKGDLAELSGEVVEDPTTWKWSRSDRLFLDFVAEAHRQGFKVILDGVFNHTGAQFEPFLDVRAKGRDSRYADWFNIVSWDPVEWISFGDRIDGNMPELKKDPVTGLAPGPRDYVLNVAKRWLAPDGDPSRGVDGFRLDYAQNVPRAFWVTFRKYVKTIKPDAYITGEIWAPATSYLQGDAWDATMQYPFSDALQAFFIGGSQPPISATAFADRLLRFDVLYPFQVSLDEMDLLDSHDTDRWASRFVNADHPLAQSGVTGHKRYNTSKPSSVEWQRMKQSVAVQMTSVGAPMVYYGDEVGMWGGTDPDDRQPMIWKDLEPYQDPEVRFKQDLFDWYVRLIAIHRRFPALQTGFAHIVMADDARNIIVYSRDLGDAHVYVLVNRSAAPQSINVAIGPSDKDVAFTDWLDPDEAEMKAPPASAPDGRPSVESFPHAKPAVVTHRGMATVSLEPWGTMILTPAHAH